TGLLRTAESGTGTEVTLAGAGEHHDPHRKDRGCVLESLGEVVAHVGCQRVTRLGPVDRDASDAAFDFVADLVLDGRFGGGRVSQRSDHPVWVIASRARTREVGGHVVRTL